MDFYELFAEMDLDADDALSRSDLHNAAIRLGWQWQEASIYAVLDLLTLQGPLSRELFCSIMTQIARDPHGPYGEVLCNATLLSSTWSADLPRTIDFAGAARQIDCQNGSGRPSERDPGRAIISHLSSAAGPEAGEDYRMIVDELADSTMTFAIPECALLLIDLQRSFSGGAWLQSMGAYADREAAPIRLAFDNCARFLSGQAGKLEKMFSRCPFPPDSFDWDERFASIIGNDRPYFIKPGNSMFWPPTNGFAEWVDGLVGRGKKTLLMGGCTLNSCVRVTAMDTQQRFADRGLQVVVVLSLSGARTSNYLRSPRFGGISAVELAVRDMIGAGVVILPDVSWQ